MNRELREQEDGLRSRMSARKVEPRITGLYYLKGKEE